MNTAEAPKEEEWDELWYDFEYDPTYYRGDYIRYHSIVSIPGDRIDLIGHECAFEEYTLLDRCHIIAWSNTPVEQKKDIEGTITAEDLLDHYQICSVCSRQYEAKVRAWG